jgi:hypothetical protein
MSEERKAEAQGILDELFSEGLIPFELFAGRVECIGPEEYIVRFYDSRLHSVDVSWLQDQCFRDVFRAAVLERVERMTGPLLKKAARSEKGGKCLT